MLLKRLKIVLQSKYLYYIILIIAIIYTIINVLLINKQSLYSIDENNFILKVTNIKEKDFVKIITFKGKEKIISYSDSEFAYSIGDIVRVKGSLSIPSKNTIPNLFDYQKYLNNENIYYILDINECELVKENQNIFYKIKSFIIDLINKYKSKNYLQAFILGNTSYINNQIKEKYQLLGVNHLFAISGMHVSLLIIMLTFVFDKLKVNKYISFIFNSLFLIFYAFLVNFQVSIMRSVLSYICLSINKFLKLNIKSEYIIIMIFSVSLLFNPFNIHNLGFQYSYLISFVLIKYSCLIKGSYLKKMFIVSFLAFIGGLPITIINNYEFNSLTILFNIIYVPLISIIIFPCAILCIIFPFLDNVFYYLTFVLEKITMIMSDFSIMIILKKPSTLLFITYFIIIFYCLNGLIKRSKKRFIILFILIFFHYNINFFINNNFVIFFDVGQGDSILIHNSNTNTLIDTGGSYYKEYYNDLIDFMKSYGIRSIQNLIISHGDYDHMGEAIKLVEKFKIEKVIFNCGEFNELENDLIKLLDKKKIPYYSCIKELNIDDNKLYFLNNKDYGNENDNSSVIYTKINNYKFLFMGDAGIGVEEDLIEKYNLQDIDVLKVGHHGSRTSSGIEFINEITPKYSIISVGKNNRYGHPNKEVLNNLDNSNVYRTDRDGSVMFKIKKDKLRIETCSP